MEYSGAVPVMRVTQRCFQSLKWRTFSLKKEKKKKKLIKEVRRLDYHDHVTDRPVHIGERMYLLLENTDYGI